MKKSLLPILVLFFSIITLNITAQFRIVGYLNTWDDFPNNAKNIDYTKITHLNIAFANPDADGNFTIFSGLSTVVNKGMQIM